MYTLANMQESIKKVEATRAQRMANEPRRMTADEKDALLAAYHPDYKEEGFITLKVGPNKGEKVPTEFYEANGIAVNERGNDRIIDKTLETCVEGVYVAGDGAKGAATIVEAIRDAQIAVKAILGHDIVKGQPVPGTEEDCYSKKAILKESKDAANESERCLTCNKVCENCVDVCPNRANISIKVPGMAMNQVIHVDYMCNECGNCKSFCPYASAPYKDKFTLFASEADMADSTNDGFAVINPETKECKVRLLGQISDCKADDANDKLYEGLRRLICAVIDDYGYLIMK